MNEKLSRRRLLSGISAGVVAGIAGCSSIEDKAKEEANDSYSSDVEVKQENVIDDIQQTEDATIITLSQFELKEHSLSDPTTVDYIAILTQDTNAKVRKKNAVHKQLRFSFKPLDNGTYTAVAYGESTAGDGDTYWTAHYVSFVVEDGTVTVQNGRVDS